MAEREGFGAFAVQTALQVADSTLLALPIMPRGSRCIARYCPATALVLAPQEAANGLDDRRTFENVFPADQSTILRPIPQRLPSDGRMPPVLKILPRLGSLPGVAELGKKAW